MISSKVAFALNARVQLTSDEDALVRKYGLDKQTVYDSEARKQHQDSAAAHAEYAQIYGQTRSAGRALYGIGRSVVAAAMAAVSLHVTIDSLVNGQHIETKSLDELLGAETAIREACDKIKLYLETAATFDGREEICEI